MRTAIIAITSRGAAVAQRLAPALGDGEIFLRQREDAPAGTRTFTSLSALAPQLFAHYRGLVFIMATGIAVRVIAPLVRDKYHDPAVVVVDEAARHAISLLSGHMGGANDLARQVAAALGATPVITTATDLAGIVAPDVLARRLDMRLEPHAAVKTVNAALAAGRQVMYFVDDACPGAGQLARYLTAQGLPVAPWTALPHAGGAAAVLCTDRLLAPSPPHLFLRPRTIAVGVGCRRGAAAAHIIDMIEEACRAAGRSSASVAVLCSAELKRHEPGLLAAADHFHAAVRFFSTAALAACLARHNLAATAFVYQQIGVGGVCEPAAILGADGGPLLRGKTARQGVTVALAAVAWPWSVWDPAERER